MSILVVISDQSPLANSLPMIIFRLGWKTFYRLSTPEKFTSNLLTSLPSTPLLFIPKSLRSYYPSLREIKDERYQDRKAWVAVPQPTKISADVGRLVVDFLEPSEISRFSQTSREYQGMMMKKQLQQLQLPYRQVWEKLVEKYGEEVIGPFGEFYQPEVAPEYLKEAYQGYGMMVSNQGYRDRGHAIPDSVNLFLMGAYLPPEKITRFFLWLDPEEKYGNYREVLAGRKGHHEGAFTGVIRQMLTGARVRGTDAQYLFILRFFSEHFKDLEIALESGRENLIPSILGYHSKVDLNEERVTKNIHSGLFDFFYFSTKPDVRERLNRMIDLLLDAEWKPFLRETALDNIIRERMAIR